MSTSSRRQQSVPAGVGPLDGVLEALASNRQQLQHNLRRGLAPFAHVGGGGGGTKAAAAAAVAGQQQQQQQQWGGWNLFGGGKGEAAAAVAEAHPPVPGDAEILCFEYTKGKRRLYSPAAPSSAPSADAALSTGSSSSSSDGGFAIADDAVQHRQRVRDLLADYLLPQGFPESVAPEYSDYMRARSFQYFFGGAMSVFTTKSLLSSLGVSNKRSSEGAAAINWVLKDGAGRLGRFLFARWGRELDCELKQFRLAGDVLMEAGAALELSTVLMPGWFLPLACTANLAKNLAAVAASSTRAPIYRTFAKQNNLADVTAKGESVANLADVVGTAFGIALAKANLPVVPTFAVLSVGYLISSRREVDAVVLPYLNRARLSYAARAFCSTGAVPGTFEANSREPLMPWSDPHSGRVVLGATVEEACTGPRQLQDALASFAGRDYALTYRPDSRKCYVLLKRGASQQSVLQGAMDAHCLLWMLDEQRAAVKAAGQPQAANGNAGGSRVVARLHRAARQLGTTGASSGGGATGSIGGWIGGMGLTQQQQQQPPATPSSVPAGQDALDYVAREGRQLYQQFERQATASGWRMHMTMLNPRQTRLVVA